MAPSRYLSGDFFHGFPMDTGDRELKRDVDGALLFSTCIQFPTQMHTIHVYALQHKLELYFFLPGGKNNN